VNVEQQSLIPVGSVAGEKVREPAEIMREALEGAAAEGSRVVARVCLISGGNDSVTTAHRLREFYDELAFIDTGTALPGVRDFTQWYVDRYIGKPLRVFEAGPAFAELVLGDATWWDFYSRERLAGETLQRFVIRTTPTRRLGDGHGNVPQGFPGPGRGGHRAAYARLKERCVEDLVRTFKAERAGGDRRACVALLTGARRHESRRRSMTQGVDGWRRKGGQLWVNPLNDWTNERMVAYRREHDLPQSDVAAILHRSGECNCGAFMAKGELEEVKAWFGDWHRRTIVPLEDAAREAGIPRCVWGERTDTGRPGAAGWDFSGSLDAQIAMLAPDSLEVDAEMCSTCEVMADPG
jgi:3'-phosphoadenosine 5'-phosphosulfate sulfotransferase (PAPS reductase)/FAD synthetase